MSEFVGHAVGTRYYSYPETPRGGGALAFARNSGTAGDETSISQAGVQVQWTEREVAGATNVDVPITPRVTGIIRFLGMFYIQNEGPGNVQDVTVTLQVNGSDVASVAATVETVGEGSGSETIPFILTGPGFTVGTTYNVQFKLSKATGSGSLLMITGTVDVQELPRATG